LDTFRIFFISSLAAKIFFNCQDTAGKKNGPTKLEKLVVCYFAFAA